VVVAADKLEGDGLADIATGETYVSKIEI